VRRLIFWHDDKASLARQETKTDHKVLITTKPGECILVDQILLMEVGFYTQLTGKLDKKRYKCAIVFVNHFSHLQLIHLQLDN
jgi:hypothetical protein